MKHMVLSYLIMPFFIMALVSCGPKIDPEQTVGEINTIPVPVGILKDSINFAKFQDSVINTPEFKTYTASGITIAETEVAVNENPERRRFLDFLRRRPRPTTPAPPIPVVPLPNSYVSRTFLLGDIGLDVFMLPGNLVRKTAEGNYEIKTLTALIKNYKTPIAEAVSDGLIYEEKVDKQASFNASAIIGGLKVEANELMELIIQDVTKASVPDSLIDQSAVSAWISRISPEDLSNWYYIKLVTLTHISNKKLREGRLELNVNASYVTAGGKAYSSNSRYAKDRIVSMRLVSLSGI